MAKKVATKTKKRKNIAKKTLDKLILKGKRKGFLTYDEINKALPENMFSLEQIDETLIMFNELNIEIIDEKKNKLPAVKKLKV
ncbi:MAG: RNA polymerase sigma factor region1.1 domain-containing protein, partial [Deltaproteobacteria bacterium]|nr:RNA polymerase sigma factor region1.1 domain-containing protein [Deltaproteobacteria bacterium]